MSSILKALRKIEEEKRVASHAAPDLRMDQGNSSRKARPFLPLAAGLVLGAICVGLFSYWSSPKKPAVVDLPVQQSIVTGVENRQPAPSAVELEEKLLPVPEKLRAAPADEQISAPVAEVMKVREVIMPADTVPMITEQTEPPNPQANIVSENITAAEVVAPKIVATTATRLPEAELTSAKLTKAESIAVKPEILPEGVHLKVSEIFYHEDPANSMAVVNDLPVMTGTSVDSAMVQKIYPGKVAFKIDGTVYDVPVTRLQ